MQENEREKILIVDEDTNYISILRKSLSEAGFEVIYFDDTRKALEIITNLKPNLIIADVELAERGNYSFFQAIKSNPGLTDTPFIFLSGQKRVDDRIKTIEMGVDDFITKPFFTEEVVARIENLFGEIRELENDNSINENGFSGNLSEMNLLDLMQTLDAGKKSCIIHLKQDNYEGEVYIQSGDIYDAIFQEFSPEEAFYKLILWTDGRFFVEMTEFNRPKAISRSKNELIEQGHERLKNWERIKRNLPPLSSEIAVNTVTLDTNNVSNDEQKILSSMNGKNTIFNIVLNSSMDDIKTLEILSNLYQRDYFEETGLKGNNNNVSHLFNRMYKKNFTSQQDQTSSVMNNLLNRQDEKISLQTDRRREERRQTPDRRLTNDRRTDRRIYNHKLYLDKSELLMIREKLL